MHRRDFPCSRRSIGGRRFRADCCSVLVALAVLLTLVIASGGVAPVAAQQVPASRSAEPLPSPMSGIEVSESQRTAMRASWALVAGEWDAILARSRAAGTVSTEDSRRLARLASEHNERLLGIFTPEQRGRLERNLEALRVESERRAEEAEVPVRTPPPSPARDDEGSALAGVEVVS